MVRQASARGVRAVTEWAYVEASLCLYSLSAHQKGAVCTCCQDIVAEMLAKRFKIVNNRTLVIIAVDSCGSALRAAEQSSHKI